MVVKKDREFYEGFYEERITTSWLGDLMKVTERLRQYHVARAVEQFRPQLPFLRLVDVGCGRGQLTPCLIKHGEVLGLDYSRTAVEYCRRKYPEGTFEIVDFLDERWNEYGPFHVIVSTEVVEHVPRDGQKRFVNKLWSLLESGGLMLLTTPDRATADLLKVDPSLDDDEYYRQYEGQPIADLLNRSELAGLMPHDAEVLLQKSYSPVIRFRPLDIVLKGASMPLKYAPLQWVGDLLGLPCKSQLLLVRKP